MTQFPNLMGAQTDTDSDTEEEDFVFIKKKPFRAKQKVELCIFR